MFGLELETINQIKEVFKQFPQIEKVIIYGSRALENYRNGSDIDITLIGDNLTLKNTVYPLIDALDELYLPYMFDVSIFKNIDNKELVEHIEKAGKLFYSV